MWPGAGLLSIHSVVGMDLRVARGDDVPVARLRRGGLNSCIVVRTLYAVDAPRHYVRSHVRCVPYAAVGQLLSLAIRIWLRCMDVAWRRHLNGLNLCAHDVYGASYV